MGVGAAFQGRCYAYAGQAADAYFSAQSVGVVSGATSYATEFSKVSGVWKTNAYSIDGSGVWSARYSTDAQVPIFPVCDTAESFNDGMLLGWGIAGAMVCTWAIAHMRRGLGIV